MVFVAVANPFVVVAPALSQSVMSGVDLSSPAYSTAEMSRTDIEKLLASGHRPDLSMKSLNGLDLSGLDLTGVSFRAARVNKTKFTKARLVGAIFDQTWALEANFDGADLSKASLFAAQMQGSSFRFADFSGARIAGDFSRANLRDANFAGADLSADMKNQSMGLMRVVFRSADLEGSNFKGANLARADLQFAKLGGANLSGADISGAEAGGADFRAALLSDTNLSGCDVTSARITQDQKSAFAKADHLDRALVE